MKNIYSYKTLTLFIFIALLTGSFTFFTLADNTNLTLFEDFDRDGISNAEEETLGTDPRNEDTDGDGYSDGVEVESGYNPLIPAPGDRIVTKREPVKFAAVSSNTDNVTEKISESVVSFIADAQESGQTEVSSEEFNAVIKKAVDKEVEFTKTTPINVSEITVKKRDCDGLSDRECREKTKEEITEYITAVSYIFVSNFPSGFFQRSTEEFESEIMTQLQNFSGSLTNTSYFEDLAKNAMSAEEQMHDVTVPEEMLDVHVQGLYLLRYAGDIYKAGNYKNVNTDVTPMIATLAQIQGLIDLSIHFQESVTKKLTEYEINDVFFDF